MDPIWRNNSIYRASMQAYLNWQLNLTPMSEIDQLIAASIIDGIDTDGYLTVDGRGQFDSGDPWRTGRERGTVVLAALDA